MLEKPLARTLVSWPVARLRKVSWLASWCETRLVSRSKDGATIQNNQGMVRDTSLVWSQEEVFQRKLLYRCCLFFEIAITMNHLWYILVKSHLSDFCNLPVLFPCKLGMPQIITSSSVNFWTLVGKNRKNGPAFSFFGSTTFWVLYYKIDQFLRIETKYTHTYFVSLNICICRDINQSSLVYVGPRSFI